MRALARLSGVTRAYGSGDTRVHALRGVTLDIAPGEFVSIVGPSGSGKSSLANIIGCLDRPTSGRCEVDGLETTELDATGLALVRRRSIGFVFQGFQLLSRVSALANVELPLAFRGIPGRSRTRMARAALDAVGLADRFSHLPSELSGGQQQRVAIARAIVTEPKLIVADEPTAALDATTAKEILALLKGLVQDKNVALAIITHDLDIARSARRMVRLEQGLVATIDNQKVALRC